MSTCHNCNASLDETAKFCTNCGELVSSELICTSCGAVNSVNAKFCTQCGERTTPHGVMGHIKSAFSSDPNKEVRKERIQAAVDMAIDTANRERDDAFFEAAHQHEIRSELGEAEIDSIQNKARSKRDRAGLDDEIYGLRARQQVEIEEEKARQDLQIEKMSAMQKIADDGRDRENSAIAQQTELHAKIASEHAELTHRLAGEVAERVNKAESEKRESLKDLSPEQILAIQAGELAGKDQDISVIASAISGRDAEREKTEIQAKLHKEMLDVVKESGAKTTQAYKDAADQARSMGEKSLESVAKIAGAKSPPSKQPPKKVPPGTISKQTAELSDCINPDCDAKVGVTDSNFCGQCGCKQSD